MQPNFIAGRWVSAETAAENRNPSDLSDLIGHYASGTPEDVDQAAQAAAMASKTWGLSSPQVRADALERIGAAILARKDELGQMLAREEGKTLPEAIGETVRAAQIFKFFAQEAVRIAGDAIDSVRPNVDVMVTREPVGVIGLITPWNFPIAIPAWKIAPALCYGNCVVFKPADLTPGTAHLLAQIIAEAGLPDGVFNLVMGAGSVVGQAIVQHPLIQAISFTGSVPVGRAMAVEAAKGLKKVQLEMGGKNPMVVMQDADLPLAIEACLNGAFYSTGQRCTASSRLIVHRAIYDEFCDQLIAATGELKVGHALEHGTQIGPVVSRKQLESNLSYVSLAAQEGADVIGGEQLNASTEGFFQRPAIFRNARNDMRTSQEEIFGPCASVIPADDFDHALALANETAFGLSSGICTGSLKYAREFRRKSEAGMVMVNLPTAGVDYHVPFGGRKGSSLGSREQGRHAAEFYTSVKTAYSFAG
ncbi:aldehyde dehydrogenase family protein [Thalassobius vesicularis]|uniref:Aldehyde dehydrogenase family protein n=1 Tax=Thalassobius vesicularis TaxID=1294297 RepID=A0A4S3M756_9RHOB|nr:aldehyde dehydrogenase family protein [Thalassobius vesicularis]THD72569.1 aldehyde dehydrogenase family protein [Thalassobius vesicularis]